MFLIGYVTVLFAFAMLIIGALGGIAFWIAVRLYHTGRHIW
jgi:hypothetical protein